jgi:hypothetical protein
MTKQRKKNNNDKKVRKWRKKNVKYKRQEKNYGIKKQIFK